MDEHQSNRRNIGWHISKEISLPALTAIAAQTIAFVWWLASLSTTVGNVVAAQTKTEARVESLSTQVVVPIAQTTLRIETVSARVFALEEQLRQANAEINAVKVRQAVVDLGAKAK